MQKISKKIDREILMQAIIDKFGTYTACANALKITNDNLANKMNRL